MYFDSLQGNVPEDNYKQVIQEVASLTVEASPRDQTEENFVVVTEILLASATIVQDPEVIVIEEEEVIFCLRTTGGILNL